MRVRRFAWEAATPTATKIRLWHLESGEVVPDLDVEAIKQEVREGGDEAVLGLNARLGAAGQRPASLPVAREDADAALATIDSGLREALEVAAENIRAVAEAQLEPEARRVGLPEGQTVTVGSIPVAAAGIYAPGGRAFYPSSVLMCAIPARVAGVERVVLASPPGPDGELHPIVLAAASISDVDEIFAMGGAQAIFALTYGTESVAPVDVIAGPGNAWVQEAKREVHGLVGIDSYAGPSELMVIAGHDADPEWVALDLCAQAEHGDESPLLVAAVEERVLDSIEAAVAEAAESRPSVTDAPLATVQVPDAEAGIALANAYAPEHLELVEEDAALLAGRVATAGCVFVGRMGATAFGDYVAGSNHVLPTSGAGRFSGPLGPGTFRRRISTVEIPPEAAAKLAPHVETIARAEGFPVHGESAMIRSQR
ncbi:MAG TPA: histidinol dehydrogenase [Solirubrobacterales bacterium]